MTSEQDHTELISKIITGARWATALRLFGQIFSWISTIIVVRFLAPADYGLNSMLQSPMEVMMFLSVVGLDVALVQTRKLEEKQISSVFGWLLLINGLLFLAYFFGGALLASYYNEPELDLLAKVLAFVFLLAPFRIIPNALLDRELKFKLRAQVDFAVSVCSTLLIFVLAIMGAGVWALVLGYMASLVLKVIVLMILEPWLVKPSLQYAPVRGLMAFGGISTATGVVAMVGGMIVTLIVGRQLGSELLGIYAVAMQFALLPLAKLMPVINQSLVPAFSKFQSQPDLAIRYLNKAMGIASLVLIPAMIGMACIADVFVQTILGNKWAAAVLPLILLSIMALLKIVTSFVSSVMNSMGHPAIPLKSSLVMFVFLIPAILIGVRYGVTGLSIAVFATELIGMLVTVRLSKRAFAITFLGIFGGMRPALFSSVIMAVCVLGVRGLTVSDGWIDLLLGVGVGVISYFLALRFLFVDKLRDAMLLLFGGRFSRFLPGP